MRPGSVLVGPRTLTRRCASAGPFPDHRSPDRSARVHSPLDEIPSRVPHHLSAARPCRADSPGVLAPVTTSVERAPSGRRRPRPLPVPSSGSLNLSTVSWQARPRGLVSCRCRPGPPFRAFPSQRAQTPLSRPAAPLRSSTEVQDARPDTLSPLVSPTPAPVDAVAWIPQRLWAPFPQPSRAASRSPWAPCARVRPYPRLHPLRSLVPPVSPFAPAGAGGRCSPGFLPLQGVLPPDLGISPRPSRANPGEAPHGPRAARVTSRTSNPGARTANDADPRAAPLGAR